VAPAFAWHNFGAPSSVKAWGGHLARGLSIDPETRDGPLGGRDFVVLTSRGGGNVEGTNGLVGRSAAVSAPSVAIDQRGLPFD
jgi:hypothetical protein